MFKFGEQILDTAYNESGQRNPIRWEMLWKDEEGTFHPQAGVMKCKDYFNDVVSAYNGGPKTPIYGFDVSKIKLNDEGQWLRLTQLREDEFETNVTTALLPELNAQLEVPVELTMLSSTSALLFLPRKLYSNTYTISLVTQLIRACNYCQAEVGGEKMCSIKDLLVYGVFKTEGRSVEKPLKWGIFPPEKYKDYWCYYNSEHNSLKSNLTMETVHLTGWSYFHHGVT